MLSMVKRKLAPDDPKLKRFFLYLGRKEWIDRLLFASAKVAPRQVMYLSTATSRSMMAQLLLRHPELLSRYFEQSKVFALFLSTSRSGHSIMAHLLSAHPKVLICDELAAISYFNQGYSKEQVFSLIKYQDYIYIRKNRVKSGYSYKVEGTWQNVFDKFPSVMGDAKGSRSIRMFGGEKGDSFLNDLRSKLGMPLRIIVHLRNPFDFISTRVRRRGVKLSSAVGAFIKTERQMNAACNRLAENEKWIQYHEEVVADPTTHFVKMFEFLGVHPDPEIVRICAGKIWKKPNVTRGKIDWPEREVTRVNECISRSPLFHFYKAN